MGTHSSISTLLIIVSCAAVTGTAASAQTGDPATGFPGRPVRVVVPFAPGGQPDIFTRLIGPSLVESFGQQVVVDNRPGAGGMVGSRIVADSTPDGHTLLSISSAHTIGPFARKVPYNTQRDFAGVTLSYNAAYLLVVPPSLGVKTLKELIALAKSKPGALNFASAGTGSGTHFAGEMLKHSTGIDAVHVPYRGIPQSLNDVIAGRVQFFMAPLGSSANLVRDGRIRALGVTTAKRIAVLPDVPTIAESGLPGFQWDSWGAIFAPSKTPRAIINRWNHEIRRAVAAPDVQKRLRAIGMEAAPTSPEELDRFVKDQMAIIAKLAKAAGLKPQ
jgi:tripartite-type tricarboxylate transporter receptor subunit TctC